MSFIRIKSLLWHNWYYQKRSLEAWVDVFWWSTIAIVVFWLIALYFAQNEAVKTQIILLGILFWEIPRVAQLSISLGVLRDVWSRNLSNLFTTPLSVGEFLVAQMIVGFLKSFSVFIIISVIAFVVYDFSIYRLGLELPIHFINLLVFSWSAGMVITALIFRYGNKIQAFAWSLFFLLQPVAAVFYPIEVMPKFMQKIALLLPLTYVFEGARQKLFTGVTNVDYILIAIVGNIIYFVIAYIYFIKMFKRARESGMFARLEA